MAKRIGQVILSLALLTGVAGFSRADRDTQSSRIVDLLNKLSSGECGRCGLRARKMEMMKSWADIARQCDGADQVGIKAYGFLYSAPVSYFYCAKAGSVYETASYKTADLREQLLGSLELDLKPDAGLLPATVDVVLFDKKAPGPEDVDKAVFLEAFNAWKSQYVPPQHDEAVQNEQQAVAIGAGELGH